MLRLDLYTKTVLTVIALLLGAQLVRPILTPTPAQAQTPADEPRYHIEPGTTGIRDPNGGGSLGEGKVVIDLRTGEARGFPTNAPGAPYPINITSSGPGTAKAIYLGRFDFGSMKRP